jgi:ABC-type uncharacterized transport system involved in gliding motility auxiliary subunit
MVMKQKYNLLLLTINIVLYFVIVALWISIPDSLTLDLSVTSLNLFITLLLIYLNQEGFKSFYQSAQFKKFTDTLIFVVLIFSLLSLANYWTYKHPIQTDLSLFKLNTLTDQTRNVLKKMKGKVTMKVFARKQESYLWQAILDLYRFEKNDLVIEKIDIDVRPDLVQEYHITEAATLVIEYNEKRQFITDRDEINITNGLIKISRDSDPVVYFLTGHNEGDISSKETEGLKYIFEAIKNSAVDIRSINLTSTTEIPFDAKTVILWGPKTKLMVSEIKTIERFLERGGNFLVGIDPDLNTDAHREIRDLLLKYHLNQRNDLIIDKRNFVNGSNGTIPLVENYNKDHSITKKFKGQTFFPLVSSVEEFEPHSKKADEKITFLTSSNNFPDSWGETSLKEILNSRASYTAGADLTGPLNIGAAYESSKNKIVAFGNSTFVLNAYMKFGNNYLFFINSLSWLVDEDRLISFNLPIIQSERLFISGPQLGIIFYFSVIFIPLILFGMAIFMYRRRRVR